MSKKPDPRQLLNAVLERITGSSVGSAEFDDTVSQAFGLSEVLPFTTDREACCKACPPGSTITIVRRPDGEDGPRFKAIVAHPQSAMPMEWWADTPEHATCIAGLHLARAMDLTPEGLFK